jgi:pyruvate,orthophosphate dikinase
MYSSVVLGLSHDDFEEVLDDHKDRLGLNIDTDLICWHTIYMEIQSYGGFSFNET